MMGRETICNLIARLARELDKAERERAEYAERVELLEKILCEALQSISHECGTKQCHDYVEGLAKEAGLGDDWYYGERAER